MKVLHILYQSLPTKVGSTIRSRDILMSQKESGIEVEAISSPFQSAKIPGNAIEIINGIKYHRFPMIATNETVGEKQKSFFLQVRKLFRIFSFVKMVKETAKKLNPDVIHAHSTFFTGYAGLKASKMLNIPFVYEVRSLWEEHRKVVNASLKTKIQTKIIRFLENRIIKKAQVVIVLNEELKKNILKRGFNENKFIVISNAVNISLIPFDKIKRIKSDKIVFGYIGSIITIEGLDVLIKVFGEIKSESSELLIFGNGAQKNDLELLVKNGKYKNIRFMGEVESDKIYEAYNQIDIIINPRIGNKITNDVTPLKPIEAMAYGKLIVASDVGGMKEIITHGINGLLFRHDDEIDLRELMIEVISNGIDYYQDIVINSQKFVKENRSWLTNAEKYKTIYSELIKTHKK